MTIGPSKLKNVHNAIQKLKGSLKKCVICPRRCAVDRLSGKKGYCRAGLNPVVYSYLAHHGEEPAISGKRGSGTIFFAHCNMKCLYCQNYYFSQLDNGEEMTVEKLSSTMMLLQKEGCHNINLVSPTHYVPQILAALELALQKGLTIPIVYNTGCYDSPDTIKLLDGIVDIYMPDMRYSCNDMARKYSDAPNYVEYNRVCVKEMYRQAGDLTLDGDMIAKKGLIIRLLVLPYNISGTTDTLKFIRDDISKNTYLSVMSQYYPTFKAYNFKDISRGVETEEYENVVDEMRLLGLNNGWVQESPESLDKKFRGTNIKQKKEI